MPRVWLLNKYRGSSDSTDSISTVLGIVRFPISTKLPKLLDIVRFFSRCSTILECSELTLDCYMYKKLVKTNNNSCDFEEGINILYK